MMNRLPPPPQLKADDPTSWVQGIQWLMGRVYHIDECLDETKVALQGATKRMDELTAWQRAADEAEIKAAAARAERRRWVHYGYLFWDFVDKHGWRLVAGAIIGYELVKRWLA